MHLIFKLLIQTAGNAAVIFGLSRFLPAFTFSGTLIQLAVDALILTALNRTIRPILKLILSPVVFITLGLFSIVINGAIIFFLDIISDHIIIQGNFSLLIAGVLVGLVNLVAAKI